MASIAVALFACVSAPARAVDFTDPDFLSENAVPGATFDTPTGIAFLPDGRMLVTEKRGRVYVVQNGVKLATPMWQRENEVLNQHDRGLLGIAVDPNYASNRFIYLLYTVDPDSNGTDTNSSAFSRLTRYQVSAANPNVADMSTRTVLMGTNWPNGPASASPSHTIGSLRWGTDGSLIISSGDGASYTATDAGGLHSGQFSSGRTATIEDIGAFRSQYLGSLAGKILRINPANGHGYPSNPFWNGNPTSVQSRVWAYGVRNPFRITVRPGTGSTDPAVGDPGTVYVGDVGWNVWEDMHAIKQGGVNCGWPCFEGIGPHTGYQGANPSHSGCGTIGTPSNPSPHTPPIAAWHHSTSGLTVPPGFIGNASAGAVFYTANAYPATYQNKLFFADYGQNWIKVMEVNANDELVAVTPFATNADGPVDIALSPLTNDLHYVAINTGEVRRIRYTGAASNLPPVAVASADPTSGVTPLVVSFSSAGSGDPDGDALTFAWDFGDGNSSTAAHPSHTYTSPGDFTVTLTVDDGQGGTASANVLVSVDGDPVFPQAWAYRREIQIANPGGTALSGFQVAITLPPGFDYAHARANGRDLRFTTTDTTMIPFWVERWDSVAQVGRVWVKVPQLPPGGTTVHLYYGNPTAAAASNGDATFEFFDDFEGNTAEGYWSLGPRQTIMVRDQPWETEAPHTLSVVPAPAGASWTYYGYYGLEDCTGIGMAGSNNLTSWTKFGTNPLLAGGGERWPHVVKDGGTYHMVHDINFCGIPSIVRRTSSDGLAWSAPTQVVAPQSGMRNQNPNLWHDPNDGQWYFYWFQGDLSTEWRIMARTATTPAGLASAPNQTLLTSPITLAAPNLMYRDGEYFLSTEILDGGLWRVRMYSGPSPLGPFTEMPGNPILDEDCACMFQTPVGNTLYEFYCKRQGGVWRLDMASGDLTQPRPNFIALDFTRWTDQGGAWTAQTATQPDGATGTVAQVQAGAQDILSSSYSASEYSVETYGLMTGGRVLGVAARMPTATNGWSLNLYEDLDGAQNLYLYRWTGGSATTVWSTAVGPIALNAWYKLRLKIGPAGVSVWLNDVLRTPSPVGGDPGPGSGPMALYGEYQSVARFDEVKVTKYAASDPSATVGPETPTSTTNTPPVATILAPADGGFYVEGTPLSMQGAATDAEDPAASLANEFRVVLHHNTHTHLSNVLPGDTASFVPENHEDGTGTWLELLYVSTDTGALKDTARVLVWPETDVTPTAVVTTPASPGTIAPAEYRFRIRNLGAMPTRTFRWTLRGDATVMAEGDTVVAAHDSVEVVRTIAPVLMAGPHTLRVTVDTLAAMRETDESNNAVAQALTVVSNEPPLLAAIGDRAVDEGATLAFSAAAADPESPPQTLAFSLDPGAPAGAAIDPATGAFTWTPSESEGPAVHPITIRVTDNGTPALSDAETIQIQVNEANLAPVLADVPASATAIEGSAFGFVATATDADVPAQTRTFALSGTVPDGAAIDPASGAFSWTPAEAQGPGVYPFTVEVSDGVATTSAPIEITVSEANLAPVLADVPAAATIPELSAYGFIATSTDADLPVQARTFALGGTPPVGASIDPSSGAFLWTPSETQGPGVYAFTVEVSDGVATTSAPIELTVAETNAAPVLAGVPGPTGIAELGLFGFTASATDADVPAQAVTFALGGSPPQGATIDPASGAFTWTPDETQGPGAYAFTVEASDGVTTASAPVELDVSEENTTPSVSNVPPTVVAEHSLAAFTATATDPDAPAQTLTFALDEAAPAGAAIDPSSGAFTWTPGEAQGPATYTFAIEVHDGVHTSTTPVEITVTEVNAAPALANVPASAALAELAAYGFTASALDADLPVQPLVFALVGAPAGAAIDPSTGAFTWTPTEEQGPGVYAFAVEVGDGVTTTSVPIELTVSEINAAPVVSNVPASATVDELAAHGFTATATDADTPAQPIVFALNAGAPTGAAIDPSTGAFTWTPTEAQGPGTYAFAVEASDGVATTSVPVEITVTEVNVAPALANVPASASIAELAAHGFAATATDADAPAQTLTFALAGAPPGAAIDPSSGAFAWTPTELQGPGVYSFAVEVSDGVATASAPVELTVTEANDAPVVTGVPAAAVMAELAAYAFTAAATDADVPVQPLAFALSSAAPAGAAIDPASGAFTWTPTEAQGPGVYAFAVEVGDGVTTTSVPVELTVSEANLAPALAGVPASASIAEQSAHTFTATATDADLPPQALTFALIGAPAGASIDPGTGVFSWIPTEAEGPGVYAFTVEVSDGTATASAPVELSVTEVNGAPVVSNVPATASVAELAAYAFTATATDADAPAQPLAFALGAGAPEGASIDATSGAFAWTPTEAQGPGVYPFTIVVSDGVTSTSAPIELTVSEANMAPALANVPAVTTHAELATVTFTATGTDADAPAQTLTFALSGGAPAGAAIDPSTGAFAWTPTEAQGPGVYAFAVELSDGVATVSAPVEITVDEVNVAPVVAGVPGAASVPELAPYGFTATATDADLPAQPLAFALAGAPEGATIEGVSGVFAWTPTEAQGPGVYAFAIEVSDGDTTSTVPIELTVTEVVTAAITTLTATPVTSGNDGDGTAKVRLSWTSTAPGTTVEVYRAPSGGYPTYGASAGPGPEAPTSYPPAAPWVLTSVTEPGMDDEPASREFWYYAAFVKEALSVSAASNRTGGTLNYRLADVANGVTPGQGDNRVDTADLALLGFYYGASGAGIASVPFLDYGPTTDFHPESRPLTDAYVGFEELAILALQYESTSAPLARATPAAASSGDEVRLGTPATVLAGQPFDVVLRWNGSGAVHAASIRLEWDTAVASVASATAGSYLTGQNGVTFMGTPGVVDLAVLGGSRPGLIGTGDAVVVRFDAQQTGVPAVRVASVEARDANNQPIALTVDVETGPVLPTRTTLTLASANPARGSLALRMDLAEGGPAELEIFGIDGRRVRALVREPREPGSYRVTWDGRDEGGAGVAPGMYVVRLTTRSGHWTRSVVWLR